MPTDMYLNEKQFHLTIDNDVNDAQFLIKSDFKPGP